MTGTREVSYLLANRRYRVRNEYPGILGDSNPEDILSDIFPQVQINEEFVDRLTIHHAGRVRAAGRTCERIRLSPSGYSGGSLELWIDPGKGDVLGWRRIAPDGSWVRGYRYLRVKDFAERAGNGQAGGTQGDEEERLSPWYAENMRLIPRDELEEMARLRPIAVPDRLPPGFHLVGARTLGAFEPPGQFEGFFPGLGIGRFRGGALDVPGQFGRAGNQLQVIYSDGLNTISVIQFPIGRVLQVHGDPGHIEAVLRAKADEVQRVFHVSMTARITPAGVVMLFGDVARDVLDGVADSIPTRELMGWPEGLPPGLGPEGAPFGAGEPPRPFRPGMRPPGRDIEDPE